MAGGGAGAGAGAEESDGESNKKETLQLTPCEHGEINLMSILPSKQIADFQKLGEEVSVEREPSMHQAVQFHILE